MMAGDYLDNKIFKLSTGESVSSSEMEELIKEKCHYIKHVYVGTDEKKAMVALIFPDQQLLHNPDYRLSPDEGCFCPRSLDELGRCLTGCLKLVNQKLDNNSLKINSADIINSELQIHNDSSISHQDILDKYKTLLHEKYGTNVPSENEIYFIKNTQ